MIDLVPNSLLDWEPVPGSGGIETVEWCAQFLIFFSMR